MKFSIAVNINFTPSFYSNRCMVRAPVGLSNRTFSNRTFSNRTVILFRVYVKGNVAVYKDLNLEFVTKNSFCHEFAARKCN